MTMYIVLAIWGTLMLLALTICLSILVYEDYQNEESGKYLISKLFIFIGCVGFLVFSIFAWMRVGRSKIQTDTPPIIERVITERENAKDTTYIYRFFE